MCAKIEVLLKMRIYLLEGRIVWQQNMWFEYSQRFDLPSNVSAF